MLGKQIYRKQQVHHIDMESYIPEKHLLRKIDQIVDFEFVRQLTEPLYCPNNGRPSILHLSKRRRLIQLTLK